MPIKDLIGPAFVGNNTVEFVVTRGMGAAQSVIPLIVQANHIIGDISTLDMYARETELAGLGFVLINKTDGTPVTSGSVTTRITKDGGTQTTTTNTAVHEGNGQGSITLTSTEMAADVISFQAVNSNSLPFQRTLKTYG